MPFNRASPGAFRINGNSPEVKRARNTTSPYDLFFQWVTGAGPDKQTFTAGDPFTDLLRKHHQIQDDVVMALEHLEQGRYKLGAALGGDYDYALGSLSAVPEYFLDYTSLWDGGLTGNLAATYLGSYHVIVTPVKTVGSHAVEVNFHVVNTSSLGSAMHIPGHGDIPGYSHIEDAEDWFAGSTGPLSKLPTPFSRNPLGATYQEITWNQTISWNPATPSG